MAAAVVIAGCRGSPSDPEDAGVGGDGAGDVQRQAELCDPDGVQRFEFEIIETDRQKMVDALPEAIRNSSGILARSDQ